MILALHTSGTTTYLHVVAPDGAVLSDRQWDSGRQLADELLDVLRDLLNDNGTDFTGLTGIIIFSGPGSFTSLRIGHTVANALAAQLGIPVVGTGGEDWIATGIAALPHAKTGVIAMPFYGAEANITRPKA